MAKKHGISDVTIYAWCKRSEQLESMDMKRLRQPEQENAKLKKLLAGSDLEIDVMKEVVGRKMVSVRVRRRAAFKCRETASTAYCRQPAPTSHALGANQLSAMTLHAASAPKASS